jgi:hypothetical protein
MRKVCSSRCWRRDLRRTPLSLSPIVTLSATDMEGKGLDFWKTIPTRRRIKVGSTCRP